MTAKILVIDDEPAMLYLIETMLKTKNYQVKVASSVSQALVMMRQYKPDVVCCDLMMPKMSGFDFLEYRSQSPELSNIPVIVISALGEADLLDKARTTDVFAYLPKPFSNTRLLNAIESALESVSR